MNHTWEHADLTEAILGCCFEVINELGAGFLESVYQKALVLALQDKGMHVEGQIPVPVRFRNQIVGEFFADLLVEGIVIVELKAVRALLPEHQAQVISYLKATGHEVGLLINFGNKKLEYRRVSFRKD